MLEFSAALTAGCSAIDRKYYKCYHPDCKARLKIDTVHSTNDRVSVSATGERPLGLRLDAELGVHSHPVVLSKADVDIPPGTL